ncbi:hypothetical protein ACF07K_29690, partial [Streptomyces sp. NPDC015350]
DTPKNHGRPCPLSGERQTPASNDLVAIKRQAYASIMPEVGESVVTLARWLGHSSPAITLGYYAHFMSEAGGKGRGAIDGLLGERGDGMPIETPQILPNVVDR